MPSYPYLLGKSGGMFRPMIPATIRRGGHVVEVLGLADSGADITIIPKGMAESLGMEASGKEFDIQEVRNVTRMSSDFASLEVGGAKLLGARVFFPSEEMPESDEVVLGTDPLFREFNVTFEYNARRIILNKVRH
jgi:hypothetical protein